MADRQLSLGFATKNIGGTLNDMDKIEKKAGGIKEGFAQVAKEATRMGAIIGGILTTSYKAVEKQIDKYNEWNNELVKIAGSLKLTSSETQALEARVLALGTGPLASIPGVFEHLAEATSTYLESGGDLENLETDIGAAFQFAAVNSEDYQATLEGVLGVTDAWNLENGEAVSTLEKLKIAQLNTNKPIGDLMRGLERGSGAANAMNLEFDEMISLTAGWASTGERATTMSTAILAIMEELGAETYPELIEQLELANDGQIDFNSLSQQNQKYLGALAQQVDQVKSTYSDLQTGTYSLAGAFDLFANTTMSESTRAANEFEAEMLKMGERMQELKPTIEKAKAEIQLTAMQMAEWALKNPEYVVAIVAGVMALKTAFMALKASNPVGWVIAAIEGVVALIALISRDGTKAALNAARASKQLLEEQKSAIEARISELESTVDLTAATEDLTEAQARQRGEYHELINRSSELTKAIAQAAVQTAILAEQVALEEAAADLATGAHENKLEALLGSLDTQEKIVEAQNNLADATMKTGDNTERFILFLQETFDLTQQEAELISERNIKAEELNDLQEFLNTAQTKYNTLAQSAKIIEDEQLANLARHLGILDDIEGVMEGSVELSAAEEAAIRRKLSLMLQVAEVRHQENMDAYQSLKLLYEAESISAEIWEAANERLGESTDTLERITALVEGVDTALTKVDEDKDKDKDKDDDDEYTPSGGVSEERAEEITEEVEFEYGLRQSREAQIAMFRYQALLQRLGIEQGAVEQMTEAEQIAARNRIEEYHQQMKKNEYYASAISGAIMSSFKVGLEEAFVNAAVSMGEEIASQAFTQLFTMLLTKLLGTSIFDAVDVGEMKKGKPFAKGGYVTEATPGVFGEAGPEYLVPESLVQSYTKDYGAMGAAMAMADVAGQKISAPDVNVASPNVNVNVPPPQFIVGPDGIYMLSEQGRIRSERRMG